MTDGQETATFRIVHLLSDSTGNLAQHMLTAFLTQFPPKEITARRHNFLHTRAKVEAALSDVAAQPGLVMHAVVATDHKALIEESCERLGLPCCDLTGPFERFLGRGTGLSPRGDVDRIHDIDDAYDARIEAIDFTMRHDDGLAVESIDEADVVLTGVSRTSKTPTSIFLAQQGYKVANVSLAMQLPVPGKLSLLPPSRVVGLLIDPVRLCEIRKTRHSHLGTMDRSYFDFQKVQEELTWSRGLFRQQRWSTIDVTHRAIEETAAKIIALIESRARD